MSLTVSEKGFNKMPEEIKEAIAESLAEETPSNQDWDKNRQQADEVKALNRKTQTLSEENQQLRDQIKEFEQSSSDGEEVNLDTFEDLQKAFKVNQEALGAAKGDLSKATALLEKQQERIDTLSAEVKTVSKTANAQAGSAEINKLCTPLDKKYGAQFRNEVLKQVSASFDDLGIQDLKLEARQKWVKESLENTYAKLHAEKSNATVNNDGVADPLVTDTGTGGSAEVGKGKIKEGTLQEVTEQWATLHGT